MFLIDLLLHRRLLRESIIFFENRKKIIDACIQNQIGKWKIFSVCTIDVGRTANCYVIRVPCLYLSKLGECALHVMLHYMFDSPHRTWLIVIGSTFMGQTSDSVERQKYRRPSPILQF